MLKQQLQNKLAQKVQKKVHFMQKYSHRIRIRSRIWSRLWLGSCVWLLLSDRAQSKCRKNGQINKNKMSGRKGEKCCGIVGSRLVCVCMCVFASMLVCLFICLRTPPSTWAPAVVSAAIICRRARAKSEAWAGDSSGALARVPQPCTEPAQAAPSWCLPKQRFGFVSPWNI